MCKYDQKRKLTISEFLLIAQTNLRAVVDLGTDSGILVQGQFGTNAKAEKKKYKLKNNFQKFGQKKWKIKAIIFFNFGGQIWVDSTLFYIAIKITLLQLLRKLERLQISTSSSFVKIWSACSCEFRAYFWTFWALYHLLFDLATIGVN